VATLRFLLFAEPFLHASIADHRRMVELAASRALYRPSRRAFGAPQDEVDSLMIVGLAHGVDRRRERSRPLASVMANLPWSNRSTKPATTPAPSASSARRKR
jgi:hypothetical protein